MASSNWTFLSNHAHVMVCLDRDPDRSLREISLEIGITERAVQRIVADLEEGGYLVRHREGRRNHYEIHGERPLRHRIESHHSLSELLRCLGRSPSDRA